MEALAVALLTLGNPEVVATFHGPMPTGVTVSHTGRIFVNFPRWGDKVDYTVAAVKDGKTVAYPNAEVNQPNDADPSQGFVSVQSVVVDPNDRLWVLDTGSIEFGPTRPGGPKLVGIDLKTNQVFTTILFPPDVAGPNSYLNDVRFDLRRGRGGMAFITDSSQKGPNGIVVVDLAAKKSWRKLNDHASTRPQHGFLPIVESQPLYARPAPGRVESFAMGSDGIAISADGKRLYYCPLSSRRLYSVSTDALADENAAAQAEAATVIDHGDKGASDGLESDSQGRIYCTNYEHNAILRRKPDGTFETVLSNPSLLWPDTLSLATNGYLYVTANQLHRMPRFHEGRDLRQKPYVLFRVKVDAQPVLLK